MQIMKLASEVIILFCLVSDLWFFSLEKLQLLFLQLYFSFDVGTIICFYGLQYLVFLCHETNYLVVNFEN